MDFNSIMLGSEDAPGLIGYYTNLFGEPQFSMDGFSGWQLGSGWLTVGPHDGVHGKNSHPGRLMWNLETSNVKGEFDKLRAAGAIVVQEPYTPDGGGDDMFVATLADPDDNYFQLMSPMPADG